MAKKSRGIEREDFRMNNFDKNLVKNKEDYFMFQDDRVGSFEGYTVVKKDDSQKINIRLSLALLNVADIEPNDLVDGLFDEALKFLKGNINEEWIIDLDTNNSFQYPDLIIPEFSMYANLIKE